MLRRVYHSDLAARMRAAGSCSRSNGDCFRTLIAIVLCSRELLHSQFAEVEIVSARVHDVKMRHWKNAIAGILERMPCVSRHASRHTSHCIDRGNIHIDTPSC